MKLLNILAQDLLAQSVEDLEKLDAAVDTSGVTAWDMAAAVGVLLVAWPVAGLVGRLTRRLSRRIPNLPDYVTVVMTRFARFLVVFLALAIAGSLVGVDVGWFTITIGFISVLVVLMVRPLIENLAAGLLLQTRPSFAVGDQIEVEGVKGDVVEINVRSTVIRTRDWKRVHLPNTDVLNDNITVFTAFDLRRSQIELEVEYGADIEEAMSVLIDAAASVDGVLADPAPSVRARGFGTGTVVLALRWWHEADLSSQSRTLDKVVLAVKRDLDAAGINLPSPELIVRQPDQVTG